MTKDIIITIEGVYITDFNTKLIKPEFTESTEGGISIMFTDIDELKSYHESLLAVDSAEDDETQNEIKRKVTAGLKKAIYKNQDVLDAIRFYADSLFAFIFDSDSHRKDKLLILDNVITDVSEANDSWELQKAIMDATFELGVLPKDIKSFYQYAHNEIDFYFEKIKAQLLKELNDRKAALLS